MSNVVQVYLAIGVTPAPNPFFFVRFRYSIPTPYSMYVRYGTVSVSNYYPYRIPGTTVHITLLISHPPGSMFHGRYLHGSWKSVGIIRYHKGRRCKHLPESFPKTGRSVLAHSWLPSNRAWKTAAGACDTVIYTVLYVQVW